MALQGELPGVDLGSDSDGQLARRVARGDRAAAGALIDRHQAAVRSFLWRITGQAELADDLAQETFIRLLQHAGSYREQYPMRTWLFTIARRLAINHAAKAQQKRRGSVEVEAIDHQAGPDAQAAQREEQQENRQLLDQALAQLSSPQRTALVLFHQQEVPIPEMVSIMNMPANTIKSHLHRARALLRTILADRQEKRR